MSFADPLWPDRSLRDNPFLKDHFANHDRQNEVSNTNQNSNSSDRFAGRSVKIENKDSKNKESDRFIRSVRRGRDRDVNDRDEKNYRENPHQLIGRDKTERNDLGAKIIQQAMDPFEDTWDIDRIARVLVLANSIQKDEQGRVAKEEHKQQLQKEESADIKDKMWDYATDSSKDFGSLDPARLKRVEALAKVIPAENHLIQTVSIQSEPIAKILPQQRALEEKYHPLNIGDVKNKIHQHQQQIGVIKKGFQKAEEFIKKHIPKVDPYEFEGKLSQQIIEAHNNIQEQKIQNAENLIRGIHDYVIRQCNGILSLIPNINHSSGAFYEKHLIGQSGEGLENSFYYWTGTATGALFDFQHLKGVPGVANLGAIAVQKVGNSIVKAGIEAAIYTKLTTGALGRGLVPYLPRASGSTVLVAQESMSLFSEGVAFKAANVICDVLKKSPELLKKVPEVAKLVGEPIVDAFAFMRNIFRVTNVATTLYPYHDVTAQPSVLPETDSIANQAIEEMARETPHAADAFEDFSHILDSMGNSSRSLDYYQEFVYRHQVRQFLREMHCPQEAVPYVLKNIPSKANFAADTMQETVNAMLISCDIIEYCDKYVKDPWIRNKLLERQLNLRKHYVLDPSAENYVEKFKAITDLYGLDLSKHWNKVLIPKIQVVAENFHKWALSKLEAIHQKMEALQIIDQPEKRKLFLEIFKTEVKDPIKANPLICHPKWYKFWMKAKTAYEDQQEKQVQVVGDEMNKSAHLPNANPAEKVEIDRNNFKDFYKLHKTLQFRHFKEGGAIEDRKSLIYWNYEKIIHKTEPLIGKGIPLNGKKLGEIDFKEVVKFDEICGECFLRRGQKWVPTHFAKIHHRLDGRYHIVPADPAGVEANEWEKLYGKN